MDYYGKFCHAHFVVETVSCDNGIMLHTSKHDLERAKKICEKMCRDRGLSVARKGHHADGTPFDDAGTTAGYIKDTLIEQIAVPDGLSNVGMRDNRHSMYIGTRFDFIPSFLMAEKCLLVVHLCLYKSC